MYFQKHAHDHRNSKRSHRLQSYLWNDGPRPTSNDDYRLTARQTQNWSQTTDWLPTTSKLTQHRLSGRRLYWSQTARQTLLITDWPIVKLYWSTNSQIDRLLIHRLLLNKDWPITDSTGRQTDRSTDWIKLPGRHTDSISPVDRPIESPRDRQTDHDIYTRWGSQSWAWPDHCDPPWSLIAMAGSAFTARHDQQMIWREIVIMGVAWSLRSSRDRSLPWQHQKIPHSWRTRTKFLITLPRLGLKRSASPQTSGNLLGGDQNRNRTEYSSQHYHGFRVFIDTPNTVH